jgi:hypothetical protein
MIGPKFTYRNVARRLANGLQFGELVLEGASPGLGETAGNFSDPSPFDGIDPGWKLTGLLDGGRPRSSLILLASVIKSLGAGVAYGAGLGSILFLVLTSIGFGAARFHLTSEFFLLLLCLSGLAISRLYFSSWLHMNMKLKHLKKMRDRSLINDRQYEIATQSLLNWYASIEHPDKVGSGHQL